MGNADILMQGVEQMVGLEGEMMVGKQSSESVAKAEKGNDPLQHLEPILQFEPIEARNKLAHFLFLTSFIIRRATTP